MIQHPIVAAGGLLMAFAIVGTTLVAITHHLTADQIAKNERQALLRNLHQIIPAETIDNDITTDTIRLYDTRFLGPKEVTGYIGRKQGDPIAIVIASIVPDAYNGTIQLLIGVKVDGMLSGVRVITHKETPGLGDKIDLAKSDWIKVFKDKSLTNPGLRNWKVKRDGGLFDQFTGATITPRSIVNSVKNTLIFYQQNREKLFLQKTAPKTKTEDSK